MPAEPGQPLDPDRFPPAADPSIPSLSDHSEADSLLPPLPKLGKNWKNFSMEGTGFNPILIYGSMLGFVALWFVGACVLYLLGPILTLLLVIGSTVMIYRLTMKDYQKQERIGAGQCPQCGYDLRASDQICPECAAPIPEEILRRRRLRPPTER